MKIKHSPAPWLIDAESPCHVTTQGGIALADCDLVYSALDKRTKEANARLIAHAPELHELLSRGLNSGVFDDAPVFRGDVIKLLNNIKGSK